MEVKKYGRLRVSPLEKFMKRYGSMLPESFSDSEIDDIRKKIHNEINIYGAPIWSEVHFHLIKDDIRHCYITIFRRIKPFVWVYNSKTPLGFQYVISIHGGWGMVDWLDGGDPMIEITFDTLEEALKWVSSWRGSQ